MKQKRHLFATRLLLSLFAVLTATTAWADEAVSLSVDNDIAEGTAGQYYVNMPTTGTNTLTLDGTVTIFKVYDDGGKNANYSNNCSGTLVLTAPTGYVFQLSGNIKTNTLDYLTVYDNSEASGTKLLDAVSHSRYGVQTDITTVTSSGQSMTLYFYTDGSNSFTNFAGLDLTVMLVDANVAHAITVNNPDTGGTVAASVGGNAATTAKAGETVTLTASPSSGYVLSNISVVDGNSNAVSVAWNVWTNSATFIMPGSAVTVVPTFTNDLTSLSVNMPRSGTKFATIPAGVQSFKVYDDGEGGYGRYSNCCHGTLVLTASSGYMLHLSGYMQTETSDHEWLYVYDGSDNNSTKLFQYRTLTGQQTTITDDITSSGQSMTIYFESDGVDVFAGLDLTVTLILPTVTLANDDSAAPAGSKNADKISANYNGTPVNIVLSDRSLTKDGSWNTLCLPFSMNAAQIAASDLAGATIKELNTATSNLDANGTLTLNFDEATADADGNIMKAGTPYIVKWEYIGTISNPTFPGVTISSTTPTAVEFNIAGSSDKCQFVGQYSPFSITDENKNEIIMLGANSNLGYSQNARTLKTFRAHFLVPSDPATNEARARRFVMDFGEGPTTGILTVPTDASSASPTGIFTLDGRKLLAEPTEKGMYIVNGKKVIVK